MFAILDTIPMITPYLLSVMLILLSSHLLLLPLIKRRPVFIKGIEGALLLTVTVALVASLTHPFVYLLALAIGLSTYYARPWIIWGVSLDNISSALDRAILATRSTSVKLSNNKYEIENNTVVKLNYLGMKICYIQYKSKVFSKKAELTKEIFRKFIQNYYI